MTNTTDLVQLEQEKLPLAISPTSLRHLAMVECVRRQYEHGVTDILKACRACGISHTTYYRALEDPYVQQQVTSELAAKREATHTVIQQAWLSILRNMASIAKDDKTRTGVDAARFVAQMASEVEERAEEQTQQTTVSQAARLLDRFKTSAPKTVRARRTTTIIEEVVNEPLPELIGEIVDQEEA